MNKLQDNKKGFTIIEVLIVLAIGGLILLVVFLAVPALQRNSRNTQRKSDISALAGAINEFNSNNGGAITNATTLAANLTAIKSNAKFGFYDAAVVFGNTTGTPPATLAAITSTPSATAVHADSAIVWFGYDCSAGSAAAPVLASKRSIAIQSGVEAGTGNGTMQCTQA